MILHMKILFLSKYDTLGASSRYRIFQYIKLYEENEILCKVLPMFSNNYIRNLESNNKYQILWYTIVGVVRRFFHFFYIFRYDLIYIEKEFIPYFPPLFEFLLLLLGKKYILDYDDAIFEYYNHGRSIYHRIFLRNKIPYILKNSSAVITGSPYLTKYCKQFNNNVHEIPTSIDIDKYELIPQSAEKFTIGWIGGRASSVHLVSIIDTLVKFLNEHDNVYLNLIGFNKSLLDERLLRNRKIRIVAWDERTEIQELNDMSCGIMPLKNTLIADGKCGFKLIQYMACAKPTIASPFEANLKIGKKNNNLFASTEEEWLESLESIYQNIDKYNEIGLNNRETVRSMYSIQSNAKLYIGIFKKIIG